MGAHVQVYTVERGGGAYRTAAVSGLLTGVAAATATLGHLFALRWAPVETQKLQRLVIQRLRARWQTVAGFTAAQEVGMDLIVARSYSAAHTGGTAVTLTGSNAKKVAVFPTSVVADMRIGDTGALTAGTHTFDAQPIARVAFAELAAAATVPKGAMEIFLSTEDLAAHPIVLAPNEGLVLRNSILMGAGGTARLAVELDWLELERY